MASCILAAYWWPGSLSPASLCVAAAQILPHAFMVPWPWYHGHTGIGLILPPGGKLVLAHSLSPSAVCALQKVPVRCSLDLNISWDHVHTSSKEELGCVERTIWGQQQCECGLSSYVQGSRVWSAFVDIVQGPFQCLGLVRIGGTI